MKLPLRSNAFQSIFALTIGTIMLRRFGKTLVEYIFFGNYFVGLLAIALTIESTVQLRLPFNTIWYFVLLFTVPTIYYTYAYAREGAHNYRPVYNERTQWYIDHNVFVKRSQVLLSTITVFIMVYLLVAYYQNVLSLSFIYWLAIVIILFAGILYYGLLPKSIFRFNLRNTGWVKAFVIGFVWACCANVLPLIMLRIENGVGYLDPYMWARLFVKNWMFCTVNAIMFDVKDYPTDANLHLRTFVVHFGLRKTIYFVLIPLTLVGLAALCFFAWHNHFTPLQWGFNTLPFILTIYLAFALQKRKSIKFYLLAIDGLIMFKAICGILGALFAH